jgi:hypothetical protein
LHWAAFYGHIKSAGFARGARWTATENQPVKAGQELGVVRTITRVKKPEELDARRRETLSYIRSHGPVTSREICAHFDATRAVVRVDLYALKDAGCIATTGDGGVWRWEFVQMLPRTPEIVTAPVVGVKPDKRFFEPGPIVTRVEQGVKYTFQAAPKGRFHVELLPGTGIISTDNRALTQATAGAFGAAVFIGPFARALKRFHPAGACGKLGPRRGWFHEPDVKDRNRAIGCDAGGDRGSGQAALYPRLQNPAR